MKFYDQVDVIVQSGKWWDGLVSARKEAWVPMWWPNWGNGGKWWSIILQADANINTLLHFKYQKTRKAKEWARWERTDKYGKGAEDLVLKVPVWAIIKQYIWWTDKIDEEDFDEDENISDLELRTLFQFTEHWQTYTVCKWWSWWVGNMHFKNSTVQYPDFALLGEPWQKKAIQIELQILADVGLLGFPSVGKSSIINSICQTKAKVAEYHFTTLVPNLGSVKWSGIDFNIIDIPGIIQWASEWKWLGNEFLRHVLKCKVFCFVLDAWRYDDGIKEFGMLRNELIDYINNKFVWSDEFGVHIDQIYFKINHEDNYIRFGIYRNENNQEVLIMEKSILWLVNKSDLIDDNDVIKEYINQLIKHIQDIFGAKSDHISYHHISDKIVDKNILVYNTIIQEGKEELVYFLSDILKNTDTQSYYIFDEVESDKETSPYVELIGDIDSFEAEEVLLKCGYNEQIEDPQGYDDIGDIDQSESEEDNQIIRTKKVRYVYDPEFSRLSYQLMRWKILWEQWFWKVMKKNHTINWLNRNGVKNGDLMIIQSDYDITQKKVIKFEI